MVNVGFRVFGFRFTVATIHVGHSSMATTQ